MIVAFLKKFWPGLFFVILILCASVLWFQQHFFQHDAVVAISGQTLKTLVADTETKRFNGLSGRSSLGDYGGMLFVFPTPDKYDFVMRGMLFPLDIVWINNDTVVTVRENLPPENGMSEANLTRYSSDLPANFVLEVPAGFAAKNGLKVGDTVRISL